MREGPVRVEPRKGWLQLVMNRGANALDLPLVQALRTTLAEVMDDGAPPVVIASAHPRLFCPGWDLKVLSTAARDEVDQFLRHFNALVLELFSYPSPTVAAIGGHAIAGGCSLAVACDIRVMVAGTARLGMSEVNLGVPVPAQCVSLLRARLAPHVVDELALAGDAFTAERAVEVGLVQRAVVRSRLQATVDEEMAALAGKPREAWVASKRFRYRAVWQEMAAAGEQEDSAFVECWFLPDTQQRLRACVANLGG